MSSSKIPLTVFRPTKELESPAENLEAQELPSSSVDPPAGVGTGARRQAWQEVPPPAGAVGPPVPSVLHEATAAAPAIPPSLPTQVMQATAPPEVPSVQWQEGYQWTHVLRDRALQTSLLNNAHEKTAFGFSGYTAGEYFYVVYNPDASPHPLNVYKTAPSSLTETSYTLQQILPAIGRGPVTVEDLEDTATTSSHQVDGDRKILTGTWEEVYGKLELHIRKPRRTPTQEEILGFYGITLKNSDLSIAEIVSNKATLLSFITRKDEPIAIATADKNGLYLLRGCDNPAEPLYGRLVSVHKIAPDLVSHTLGGTAHTLEHNSTSTWTDGSSTDLTTTAHDLDPRSNTYPTFQETLRAYLESA